MDPLKHHVLVIGKVWPEPGSSAAGSRILQLIDAFLTRAWKVSFASAANEGEFTFDLEKLGVKKFNIELNNESFDVFIKDLRPSIVLFDRFTSEEQFGWRVAENCPDTLRILDTEDLHCLRAARQLAVKEARELTTTDVFNDIAKRELASIYRCDLSLIISKFEMDLLRDQFKVDPSLLHYVPFLLEPITDQQQKSWNEFSSREHFISIGNFLHEPNWDAVVYLKKEIWPLIRKQLPKVEMHVYGAYATQKVFELNSPKEGFLIKGRAENVTEVMANAKVCLAPLRFGAGLKGKLIDAMVTGTPNITTKVGAEGMHGNLPWSGEIADTTEAFAQAAIKLYSEEKAWKNAQGNGAAIINNLFSKEKDEAHFIETVQSVHGDLKEHRLKNFTGSMLMHHTALSSKYMALWIEAKNKVKEK